MFHLAEANNLAYFQRGCWASQGFGALVFPSASNRSMSKLFLLLIGCLIPVCRRFISLRHWWSGRTLLAAAFPDTLRRSFPKVTARRAPRSAPRHPRSRAPRVRFPGISTHRHPKTYSHETARLPGLGPPFGAWPTPLLPIAPRIAPTTTRSREKDLLAKAGRLFQTLGRAGQRQPL